MAAIHKLSSVKPLHEFDIFSVPPTQTTIEDDLMTEHRPISTLDSKSFIEFNISSGLDEYIRLDKTLFYLRMRINIKKPMAADVKKEDWKKVSTVNNLLNSLFKQIDFSIGDHIVNPPHQTYPYKTDFEIKLGKAKELKETLLASSFWFKDQESDPESRNEKRSALIQYESESDLSTGKEFDLIGKINLSMFEQTKALIGGCNLRLKFIPHDPEFYLMMANDVKLKSVEFTDCALLVHRSKVTRPVLDGHLKALEISNAKYQIRESFVVPVTITKGTINTVIDHIHDGQFPKRAFVAFVDHSAFNGSFVLNPFNYQHFNLNFMQFYRNGVPCPDKAFTPNFEKNHFVREYLSLFEATNQDNVDSCITIKKKDYPNGNVIYCTNFAPDLLSGCGSTGYVNPIRRGALSLRIGFSKALEKAITALVYLDYDSLLEINQERNAFIEFK